MNKITKEELKNLEWLFAMNLREMSILDIAKKLNFHDLKKIEAFLEHNKLTYRKSEE